MKKFLAIFYGGASDEEKSKPLDMKDQQAFMDAWVSWATTNQKAIIDNGAPLGKTKTVQENSISDSKNDIIAYAIVETNSHEDAAEIFKAHPHLTLHPKNRIEVIEMLSMDMPQ
ncbi:MAG: hypothetical protein ACK4NC_06350 [Candidatus Gracilibacteria bacterium]